MTTRTNRRADGVSPPADRLIAAAEELFRKHTYRQTTVADICARAGIATGSFYSYFESKEALFAALVRRINSDVRAAMRAAIEETDGSQRAVERASFQAFFDLMSKRPWIYRIVREAEFVVPGLFQEYYERLTRGYARAVRRGQLAGEIDSRYDPEVISYIYAGAGYFVGMRWAEWTAGGHVPSDVVDDLLEVLTHGLPPRAP